MTDAQFDMLRIGRKYRIGMYCATSTSTDALAQVKRWQEADAGSASKYEWVFTIPAGCRQATSISAVSQYHENEILIVPYSAILVTKMEVSAWASAGDLSPRTITIHAEVLIDSMKEDLNLPTVLA